MISEKEYAQFLQERRNHREQLRNKSFERSGKMLELYMGQKKTLRQIGAIYNLTGERVRKILEKTGAYTPHSFEKPSKKCANTTCQNYIKIHKFCSKDCQLAFHDEKIKKRLESGALVTCKKCGQSKTADKFLVSRRRGLVIPHSPCRECHYKTVYRWAKNHPDQKRAIDKRNVAKYHERLKKDPIKYAEYLKKQRENQKRINDEIKNDPVKHLEYLAKARIRWHKKNERIAAEVEAALKELKLI